MSEKWKDIPGFEGAYQASTLGRVRSHSRRVNSRHGTRVFAARVLVSIKTDRGYMMVNLSVNRKRLQMPVHRAVLLAWLGIPAANMQACHNNGIRDDNRLENLRWDTPKGNIADKYAHGTAMLGERNPRANVTDAVVREIRNSPETTREIAARLGVPLRNVRNIRERRTWKHVG